MRRWTAPALIVVVVLVAVSAWVLSQEEDPGIGGLAPARVDAFDDDDRLEPGPFGAAYNQDGTLLAVRSANGVGLVEGGKVDRFTEPGADILDFAWMPSGRSAIIYTEGPTTSGRMIVLDTTGEQLGVVTMDPVVPVADTQGLAVSPDGRQAIVVTVDRPALAPQPSYDLVLVDLATGTTRRLTTTAETNEVQPAFVDQDTILFLRRSPDGSTSEASLLDTASGAISRVSPEDDVVSLVSVLGDGSHVAYASRRRERPGKLAGPAVWAQAVAGGRRSQMGELPADAPVAIDPRGQAAIVKILTTAGASGAVSQLQQVKLRPVAAPGG